MGLKFPNNTSNAEGINFQTEIEKQFEDNGDSLTSPLVTESIENLESEQSIITNKEIDGSTSGDFSDTVFNSIKKTREDFSFGSDFYLKGGVNNVVFSCDIDSNSNGIIFGNESLANTPLKMKAILNNIKSVGGNRARNGLDGVENGEHTWLLNDVETTSTEVGIESWTGKSIIGLNRIINKLGTGGFGGITMGHFGHQKALFNYVSGFGYGIEVGNTNTDILIEGNSIENCGVGIACSSDGHEKSINIINNHIKIKEDGDGISISGSDSVNIVNCIIEYESDGDYNNTNSRSGNYGIEGYNNLQTINIINCIFINLKTPLRISGVKANIQGCAFINCDRLNLGNALYTNYSNCYFENAGQITHYAVAGEGFLKVIDSLFVNDEDSNRVDGYAFNGRGNSTVGTIYSENNKFINYKENPMVQNSESGGFDLRPSFFIKNNVLNTFNKTSFSDISALALLVGLDINVGDIIFDNYTKKLWEIKSGGNTFYYSDSIPTTGNYIIGDRIINNLASSTLYSGWICTSSGMPGLWKGFGALEA